MGFFRRKAEISVCVGRQFQRRRADRTVEIADVKEISSDGFGIPHVRYELTIEKPISGDRASLGTKILAMGAFSASFAETVS